MFRRKISALLLIGLLVATHAPLTANIEQLHPASKKANRTEQTQKFKIAAYTAGAVLTTVIVSALYQYLYAKNAVPGLCNNPEYQPLVLCRMTPEGTLLKSTAQEQQTLVHQDGGSFKEDLSEQEQSYIVENKLIFAAPQNDESYSLPTLREIAKGRKLTDCYLMKSTIFSAGRVLTTDEYNQIKKGRLYIPFIGSI